ncbi:MAG: hypothetical protein ACREPG_11900, partial [Candidatus Binatia bacterium]
MNANRKRRQRSAMRQGEAVLIFLGLFAVTFSFPTSLFSADEAKVHVSGGVSPNNLLFRIGIEQGYYREDGIETQPIQAGTLIGIQGLVAGSFDFSQIIGQSGTAILRGAPLKVAMVFDVRPLAWIFG